MEQLALIKVAVSKEVDGIEMGVLEDGTPYLSGRSLARLCGVDPKRIRDRAAEWHDGNRDNKFGKLLATKGFTGERLFVPIVVDGVPTNAYTDDVCILYLEYYAFVADVSEKATSVALENFRKLAHTALRLFIYRSVGYDPSMVVPPKWRQFHDRLVLNKLPVGYFSVFREMADLVITAIQNGLTVDSHTVPDISVGQHWSRYWTNNGLESTHGSAKKYPHIYPDYFPQSKARPEAWVYPVSALPDFRIWITSSYLPTAFPAYLARKVKDRTLLPSAAELILAAVDQSDDELPAAPRNPQLPLQAKAGLTGT